MDALKAAIKHFGGQGALARELGVTQGLVWQWLSGRRPIAPERCAEIEAATGGRVLAQDLRPDVEWQRVDGRITGYTVPVKAA